MSSTKSRMPVSTDRRQRSWRRVIGTLTLARRQHIELDVFVYGAATSVYAESSRWSLAEEIFDQVRSAGLRPDMVLRNTVLSAQEKARHWAPLVRAHAAAFRFWASGFDFLPCRADLSYLGTVVGLDGSLLGKTNCGIAACCSQCPVDFNININFAKISQAIASMGADIKKLDSDLQKMVKEIGEGLQAIAKAISKLDAGILAVGAALLADLSIIEGQLAGKIDLSILASEAIDAVQQIRYIQKTYMDPLMHNPRAFPEETLQQLQNDILEPTRGIGFQLSKIQDAMAGRGFPGVKPLLQTYRENGAGFLQLGEVFGFFLAVQFYGSAQLYWASLKTFGGSHSVDLAGYNRTQNNQIAALQEQLLASWGPSQYLHPCLWDGGWNCAVEECSRFQLPVHGGEMLGPFFSSMENYTLNLLSIPMASAEVGVALTLLDNASLQLCAGDSCELVPFEEVETPPNITSVWENRELPHPIAYKGCKRINPEGWVTVMCPLPPLQTAHACVAWLFHKKIVLASAKSKSEAMPWSLLRGWLLVSSPPALQIFRLPGAVLGLSIADLAHLVGGLVKCFGRILDGSAAQGRSGIFGRCRQDGVRMCLVMDNGLAKSYGNTQHGSNGKEDIAVGEMHMCVILDNDGLNDVIDRGETAESMGRWSSLRGSGNRANVDRTCAHLMGDYLPPVFLGDGRTAKDMAGYKMTCAVLDDGNLTFWGWGNSGRKEAE
ncbi:Eno2 [Symbiodinium sp. KB8]|nr:Eno2 [Symbiodinium sp. KB8]